MNLIIALTHLVRGCSSLESRACDPQQMRKRLPLELLQSLGYVLNIFQTHAVYKVETPRCTLVTLVLMVCAEDELNDHMNIACPMSGDVFRFITKSGQKLFANQARDADLPPYNASS